MTLRLPWSRDSEVYLLEMVKENRILWDHKHSQYHKTNVRLNTYKYIAHAVISQYPELSALNAGLAQRKFKNLRTYFFTLYRKLQNAPNDMEGKPSKKWPLFEYASFLLDSGDDSSSNKSDFLRSSLEESSSEPDVVIISRENGRIETTKENGSMENGRIETTKENGHMETAKESGSIETTKVNSSTDTTKENGSKETTKKNRSIENRMDVFNSYRHKKQEPSPVALSLGLLVESSVDKLPYSRQIWFAQKLTNLIAEANNLPVETG